MWSITSRVVLSKYASSRFAVLEVLLILLLPGVADVEERFRFLALVEAGRALGDIVERAHREACFPASEALNPPVSTRRQDVLSLAEVSREVVTSTRNGRSRGGETLNFKCGDFEISPSPNCI